MPFISRVSKFLVAPEIRDTSFLSAIDYLHQVSAPARASDVKVVCDAPIFILSAGWRSGSTLLQRIVASAESTLMWGDPFETRIPVCRLARTVAGFNASDPNPKMAIGNVAGEFSGQWIGNLHPGVERLRPAHLAYFESLLALPAAERGFSRWGAKWVRVSGFHARYLQWLYPNAKFVFLVRHPLDSLKSYDKQGWYAAYPDFRVRGTFRFVAHWKYLADSFLSERERVGALLVRYEDLLADQSVLLRLEEFLGLQLDQTVLGKKVGGTGKDRISKVEQAMCLLVASSTLAHYGYST